MKAQLTSKRKLASKLHEEMIEKEEHGHRKEFANYLLNVFPTSRCRSCLTMSIEIDIFVEMPHSIRSFRIILLSFSDVRNLPRELRMSRLKVISAYTT